MLYVNYNNNKAWAINWGWVYLFWGNLSYLEIIFHHLPSCHKIEIIKIIVYNGQMDWTMLSWITLFPHNICYICFPDCYYGLHWHYFPIYLSYTHPTFLRKDSSMNLIWFPIIYLLYLVLKVEKLNWQN